METEFVLSLGDQRWTLPPGTDTITIGRASNADIRLQADDQISRIHARLARDGDSWTLHDESRNGTGLNGHRLTTPTPLTTGDRIHIGRSILTFHKSTTPTPLPPPAEPAPAPGPPVAAPLPPAPHAASAEPTLAQPEPPADPAFPAGSHRAPSQPATPYPQEPYPPAEPGSRAIPPAGPASPAGSHRAPAAPAPPGPSTTEPPGPAGQVPADANPFAPAGQVPADDADVLEPGDGAAAYRDEAAAYRDEAEGHRDDGAAAYRDGYEDVYAAGDVEYGAAGVVPGFEGGRSGDAGTLAAYPSADNPEPVRSPWEISAQIDQSRPNWNESDSRPVGADPRSGADRRTAGITGLPDQPPDRRTPGTTGLPDQRVERRTAELGEGDVGTVRLPRVLIVAGGVIALGLLGNLIVTFLSHGPGGALRWLIPPGIALVVAMVLALIDAAAPKDHPPGRFDVSVLIAIAVVLVGVGVGGFALTAGTQYVAGYLTGNESGADRLVKPVAKTGSGITVTVENVTYTSHFTRIEVLVANGGKQAFRIPIDGTTFTAADGTALRADTGKSSWPSRVAAGGSEHGTITFKGHLPDSATTAVLTFKSGSTTFAVPGVALGK